MFYILFVEKIKTHILCRVKFFPKIVPFMRYIENYCGATKAAYGNNVHALCVLGKRAQTHTATHTRTNRHARAETHLHQSTRSQKYVFRLQQCFPENS